MGISTEERIFRYTLQDAWGCDITQVDIINSEKNNVRCLYFPNSSVWGDVLKGTPSNFIGTISINQIEKIKSIILENDNLFDIHEVEFPLILDGVINIFEFNFEDMSNSIQAYNIWNYCDNADPSAKNANLVLKVFNEIGAILESCGIDMRFLSLQYE